MKALGVEGNFCNKSWRHLAISAWADILGPTNAIRIGQLSGHSTDEVKTYIRNSEEANHAETIGLIGPLQIGSKWGRTGNHLMRMDRDRMAREDLKRLETSFHMRHEVPNQQTNENLIPSLNKPDDTTFDKDYQYGY